MNRFKIFSAAIGFAVSIGALSAGNIVINGTSYGTYDSFTVNGNGTLSVTSSNFQGNPDDEGPACPLNAVQADTTTGCRCESGYANPNGTDGGVVSVHGTCTLIENQEPTDPPPGGGNTPPQCDGVGTNLARSSVMTEFSPFPQNDGESFTLEIRDSQYVAISFTAPSSGYTAALSSKKHTMTSANHLMAISSCPGDFAQELPSANCRKGPTGTNQIWFNTNGAYSGGYLCDLTPGETYYLNIAYAEGTGNNLISTCSSSRCGSLFSWSEY